MLNQFYGIRFFAIFFIALFHARHLVEQTNIKIILIFRDLFCGTANVYLMIMFVVSGYTLQFFYGEKHIDKKQFYLKRFFKIYAYTVPVVVLYLLFRQASPFQIFSSLTLLHEYIPSKVNMVPVPLWFVSSLTGWYLAFPFLSKLNNKSLIAGYFFCFLIFIFFLYLSTIPLQLAFYVKWFVTSAYFISFFCGLGVICAKLTFHFKKKITNVNRFLFTSLELFSVIFVLVVNYILKHHITNPPLLKWLLSVAPAFLITLAFSFGYGMLSRILSVKLFCFLGKISFAFYLLQSIFHREYYRFILKKLHFLSIDYKGLIVFVTVYYSLILFSYILTIFVEKITMKYRDSIMLKYF